MKYRVTSVKSFVVPTLISFLNDKGVREEIQKDIPPYGTFILQGEELTTNIRALSKKGWLKVQEVPETVKVAKPQMESSPEVAEKKARGRKAKK